MENNIIEKSNILNMMKANNYEIRLTSDNMTLTELRFFCLYLSKLNARKSDKRTVIITITEFEKLFDIKINSFSLNNRIDTIMRRIMTIKEGNKIKKIMLYSKFEWVDMDCPNEIEVTCNADIVPYLFELTNNYTSYRLVNISKLNTVSKIRLYELCKQYQKMGSIKIEINELQELLMTKFDLFKEFNRNIIIPAIKDINEYTDIIVTYEKILKCRKCVALKFFIENKSEKIVTMQQEEQKEKQPDISKPKKLKDLYKKYFTSEHEEIFKDNIKLLLQDIYSSETMIQTRTEEIFKRCVTTFKINIKSTVIKSPMAYMQGIINNLVDEERKNPKKEGKRRSYDINQFERFAINYDELQKVNEKE